MSALDLSLQLSSMSRERRAALFRALGKATALYSLAASTQSGGEYTDLIDVLNNNPGVINAARRPAVGAAANGLPIASFATNDAIAIPLVAGVNNSASYTSWAMWCRFGNLAGFNTLISISSGTNGATAPQLQLFLSSLEAPTIDAYAAGGNGRRFVATNSLTQNAWVWVRMRYDDSLALDAKAAALVNGVSAPGAYSSLGLASEPSPLATVTGKVIIGNINDGSASAALNGDIGPFVWRYGSEPTPAEEAASMNLAMPT